VSVGRRLGDGKHPRCAGMPARDAEVVTKGIDIDTGEDGTKHAERL
jgi:hypothetical protein